MLTSTKPSEWARRLVRGAYDLHVHVEPDVMRRRVTDLQLARRCWDVGLAGFALKSHYVPTAERAAVLNEALRAPGEVRVLGALTLNASVGGMNPIAVEIAAREGARILWMPTLDAANHRAKHGDLPPGATPPMWLALQRDLDAQGVTVPVVDVLDEAGGRWRPPGRCSGWPRATSWSWPPGTCPPTRAGWWPRPRSRPASGTSSPPTRNSPSRT